MLEPLESSDRRSGIVRAYDNLIELVSAIESGDKDSLPVRYLPASYYMMCVVGAIFISKVVHSEYQRHVNVDQGKRAFNACLFILKQCSVDDNDLPGRCSKLVAQFWSIHQGQVGSDLRAPTLKVASRMFYSISYDAILLWRQKYAGHPANGAPSLPPPFVPASSALSVRPSSAPPEQPPTTSNLHSQQRNLLHDRAHQAFAFPAGSDEFNPAVGADAATSNELMGTVTEELGSSWDIGFMNPNVMDSTLPLLDFTMAETESSWL